MLEKKDRALARRYEALQVKIKSAQRPKAAKFKRTVHVAFSANLS
jgi:hypothetical protein